MAERIIGVQYGRFAPYHKGHQQVTEEILQKHGAENTLIIVGKVQNLRPWTPFTFAERREMIRTIFPQLEVLPQPYVAERPPEQRQEMIDAVLDCIAALQQERRAQFHFYGGEEHALRGVASRFSTTVIPRPIGAEAISGTRVRAYIAENNMAMLARYVDERIIPIACAAYRKNIRLLAGTEQYRLPPPDAVAQE